MIILELPVFWYTPEQIKERELYPKNYPEEELATKIITFYSIQYIYPTNQYCTICSGGTEFYIKESEESVKEKIRAQIMYKWN